MIHVSYLKHLFNRRDDGVRVLHQSKVTDWETYDDWAAFADGFIATATYPRSPSNKFETYGWTPTLFEPSPVDYFDESAGYEVVRHGDFAASHLSLFIADLDNHIDGNARVSIDAVTEMLTGLGLSHILYTSFSHKPDRHKVRIVIPTNRHLTPDEAFGVFVVLNSLMSFQLDGSIYDPGDHLYGPSVDSTVIRHDAGDLVVDDWLAALPTLSEEARTFVSRAPVRQRRQPTPEELEAQKRARESRVQTADVSIQNPAVFNPKWFVDLDNRYCGGSRHQTAQGLLVRCWLKSEMRLTRGDLEHLQWELDAQLGGYLRRQYGAAIMSKDLDAVLRTVSSRPKREINMTASQALKYLKLKRKK